MINSEVHVPLLHTLFKSGKAFTDVSDMLLKPNSQFSTIFFAQRQCFHNGSPERILTRKPTTTTMVRKNSLRCLGKKMKN